MNYYELEQALIFRVYEKELPDELWAGAKMFVNFKGNPLPYKREDDMVITLKNEHDAMCMSWFVARLFEVIKPEFDEKVGLCEVICLLFDEAVRNLENSDIRSIMLEMENAIEVRLVKIERK